MILTWSFIEYQIFIKLFYVEVTFFPKKFLAESEQFEYLMCVP